MLLQLRFHDSLSTLWIISFFRFPLSRSSLSMKPETSRVEKSGELYWPILKLKLNTSKKSSVGNRRVLELFSPGSWFCESSMQWAMNFVTINVIFYFVPEKSQICVFMRSIWIRLVVVSQPPQLPVLDGISLNARQEFSRKRRHCSRCTRSSHLFQIFLLHKNIISSTHTSRSWWRHTARNILMLIHAIILF